MALLTRDQILGADDIKTEVVKVPEWGGDVTVKMMTAAERDAFEESVVTKKGDKVEQNLENFRAKLCAKTMVNANGNLMFPNPEDVKALGKKSAKALDRVYSAAQKLNGIGEKDVEEMVKNSEGDQAA